MDDLKKKVLRQIKSKGLFSPGDLVLAGFSGGADSSALLIILNELKDELKIRLEAVHVHHGIRGEAADRDLSFCRTFCEDRGIGLLVRQVDAVSFAEKEGLSLEEAARELRYQVFREEAVKEGADKIALAHHKNDQAETVLFQLIRGSALKGLSGIPGKREDVTAAGQKPVVIVRPLLPVRKEEITAFLTERGISWCEDETNASLLYSRSRLRNRVLPELEAVRKDAVDKIAETAEYLSEVDEYLNKEAETWLSENRLKEEENEGCVCLDRLSFSQLQPVLQRYIVMRAIKETGASVKDVTREHLDSIIALADKEVGKTAGLPNRIMALNSYKGLLIGNQAAGQEVPKMRPYVMILTEKGQTDQENIPNSPYTKWFDYDKISETPVLRTRRTGDVFAVLPGGKKKLNRYFIDEKIPAAKRDSIPVIACGHEILWVVGFRMSEAFKVTKDTKRILEITIEEQGE